jgi:hypothetical protein
MGVPAFYRWLRCLLPRLLSATPLVLMCTITSKNPWPTHPQRDHNAPKAAHTNESSRAKAHRRHCRLLPSGRGSLSTMSHPVDQCSDRAVDGSGGAGIMCFELGETAGGWAHSSRGRKQACRSLDCTLMHKAPRHILFWPCLTSTGVALMTIARKVVTVFSKTGAAAVFPSIDLQFVPFPTAQL